MNPVSDPPATASSAPMSSDGAAALAAAREAAGSDGVVLATGSLYLIADLLRAPGTRGSML
jgi:dihydrofolate synthase/folylpolyglutamate synthase